MDIFIIKSVIDKKMVRRRWQKIVVSLLVIGITVVVGRQMLPLPDRSLQGQRVYRNAEGGFTLDLPTGMKVLELQIKGEEQFTGEEVYFSFEEIDKNEPRGLLIKYVKPYIEGKGGACVDENGEGEYKTEMIAGQEVQVCEVGGFRAEYFRHPSREIEYWVVTVQVTDPEQIETMSRIVRQNLRFE